MVTCIGIIGLSLVAAYLLLVVVLYYKRSKQVGNKLAKKVAFFHPFCNDGGGGEKVLWTMVQALLEQSPPEASAEEYSTQPIVSIYSLESNEHEMLTRIHQRFNINLSPYAHRINIIHVTGRKLLVPQAHLTMLFHIFLPMIYCFKCLWKYQPDIFYDTTGFAFNFLLVKLLMPTVECRAYVHYPFISEDMVSKIRERRADFNNDARISQSWWRSSLKLAYYNVILYVYKSVRLVVRRSQANSTWTYDHMANIWGAANIKKLYPPCTISNLLEIKKDYSEPTMKIFSLAQFRPQKNHPLQIRIIETLVRKLNIKNIHLYVCGSTRGADDERILHDLQEKVKLLSLEEYITFCPNMKFSLLSEKIKQCHIGLHTMEAEHFGISVVEMLAGGSLVLAHNSAGPKHDIIKDDAYLANSEEQYCEKLAKIVKLPAKQKQNRSAEFRKRMQQFSEIQFKKNFLQLFHQ